MKRLSLVVVMTFTMGTLLAWHQAAVVPAYAASNSNELTFFDIQPDVYQTGVTTEAVVTAKLREPGEFVLGSGSVQLCDAIGGQVVEATCKHFAVIKSQQTSPTDLRGTFTLQITQPLSTVAFRIKIAVKRTGMLISPFDIVSVGQLVTPTQVATSDVTIPSPTDPNLSITIQQGSLSGGGALVAVEPAPIPTPTIAGQTVEASVDVTLLSTTPEAPAVTKPALLNVPAPAGTPDGTKYWMVRSAVGDGVNGGLTQKFLTMDTGSVQGGVIRTDNGNNPSLPGPILQSTNRLFQGLFTSAEVTLVKFAGTSAAEGRVCEDHDDSGNAVTSCPASSVAARRHAWVQDMQDSTGNPVTDSQATGFFSNVDGEYIVAIPGAANSSFQIRAIDGFRCASGTSSATLLVPETEMTVNSSTSGYETLAIILNTSHPPTRWGIRNPGFELSFLQEKCWKKGPTDLGNGDTQVKRVAGGGNPSTVYRDLFGFGTTIRAEVKDPNEPVTTAESSVRSNVAFVAIESDAVGVSLEQQFLVPKGVDSLLFDFNFGCLASNSTCNDPTALRAVSSRLDIELRAELVLPTGYTAGGSDITTVTIPMKNFNGQLGWRTGKLIFGGVRNGSLQPLAGSQDLVTIKFTARNLAAASTIQPAVLLDNLRFQDVIVTVTILSGAGTTPDQVRQQVHDLNEISTQTGRFVRIRRINDNIDPISGFPATACNSVNSTNEPLNTLDTVRDTLPIQVHWPGLAGLTKNVRTKAVSKLMCFGARLRQTSDPASDVQVYYVNAIAEGSFGIAITQEDYWGDDTDLDTTNDNFNSTTEEVVSNFCPPDDPRATPCIVASPSPTGFVVTNLNNAGDSSYRIRKLETVFHELGHGALGFGAPFPYVRVNSSEEHSAGAGNVMEDDACYPVPMNDPDNPSRALTLCSSRPMFGTAVAGNQSLKFTPPAPPKPGRCLEGC